MKSAYRPGVASRIEKVEVDDPAPVACVALRALHFAEGAGRQWTI